MIRKAGFEIKESFDLMQCAPPPPHASRPVAHASATPLLASPPPLAPQPSRITALSLHARYLNEAYGDDHWPWWADLQFNYAPHLLPAHPWVRGFLPYLLHPLSKIGLVPEDVPKTADLMNMGGDGLSGLGTRSHTTQRLRPPPLLAARCLALAPNELPLHSSTARRRRLPPSPRPSSPPPPRPQARWARSRPSTTCSRTSRSTRRRPPPGGVEEREKGEREGELERERCVQCA